MNNPDLARAFEEIADLLEIQGANPFRVRAYRNAAHTVESEGAPLSRWVSEERDLTTLPGIGKEMAAHIQELVATGKLAVLEELATQVPRGLLELMRLPHVGPKKAKRLWQELGVTSVASLEAAAKAGRVAELAGFGAKSQAKILAGIADDRLHRARTRLDEVDRMMAPLLDLLAALPEVQKLEVAGSTRRRKETVGDVDLLVVATDGAAVATAFTTHPEVTTVLGAGDTKASVVLRSGLQVDLRIVPEKSWGAALVYFTGSKEHNVKLRMRAVERGLKINEYGVFRAGETAETDPDDPDWVAGKTEAEVYASVDLPWIAPELREDRGELAAAEAGELPRLITLGDLKGDLQMHSTWSDGRHSIEEMLVACVERGYEYFALTDHSKALAMTGGMDAAKLRRQWREIAEVQSRHPEIRLLKSMEIDILTDGSLDLEDEAIAGLDWVLVSVHSRFELPAAEQTRRILRAVEHPAVHVLAHPTGRLINRRKPFDFDLEEVLHACAQHRVAVELNAHPERLDLKDTHLMLARKLGVPVVISTDSHSTQHLDLMPYGIEQARRAWLEPKDVLNTLPLPKLLARLAKKRPVLP